ncbi:hypothetical protein [Massilia sp. DD77]|uniref:hypothetical protein n=1 Tax=Massilia sp. DD77 TaxID=3109349 RepID=UPI002FFE7B59
MLTQSEMMKLGMALGICFAVYKFAPHPALSAGAIAVGAVIVAKKAPVLKDALA